MMEAKAELISLIGKITGEASAIQFIAKINKDEAMENIAADIEERGWKLLKLLDPEEYEKVLEYREAQGNGH